MPKVPAEPMEPTELTEAVGLEAPVQVQVQVRAAQAVALEALTPAAAMVKHAQPAVQPQHLPSRTHPSQTLQRSIQLVLLSH